MDNRWDLAQKYEKEEWLNDREKVLSQEYIDSKKLYAENLLKWFLKFRTISEESKILQVGSAAEGAIFFFNTGDRYAIDPLADFYKEQFGKLHDKRVTFIKGIGEELPWDNDFFDAVIFFNVLDHVQSPPKVLSEIHRVLKIGGVAYIGVHTYSWPGLLYRNSRETIYKINSNVRIDRGHLHSFSASKLNKLINKHFDIIDTQHDNKTNYADSKGLTKTRKLLVGQKMYRYMVGKK